MASQISIKDPQSAKQWLQAIQKIDEDYRDAMRDAASSLESMGEFMEGTAVDEFMNAGTSLLNASQATFESIDKIADLVNNILDIAGQFTEGIVGGIAGVARSIFG